MKLSHRKMYNLPCSLEDIRINNYNPLLLMLNMDLRYVGESSLAIAQYVTGYMTKAERSNTQVLWNEVSSHTSLYSKLWSFGVHSLRSRECGMYEASDLLANHQVDRCVSASPQEKEADEPLEAGGNAGEKSRLNRHL
jgi:hypothetical protein